MTQLARFELRTQQLYLRSRHWFYCAMRKIGATSLAAESRMCQGHTESRGPRFTHKQGGTTPHARTSLNAETQ
eukprot:6443619-Prymnesium_polylepis.1